MSYELQLLKGRGTASFVLTEYKIVDVNSASVCEAGNVDACENDLQSVSLNKFLVLFGEITTVFPSGNTIDQCATSSACNQTFVELVPVNLNDPMYVELELSDVFASSYAEEAIVIDTTDHMYTATNQSFCDHLYSAVPSSAKTEMPNLCGKVGDIQRQCVGAKAKKRKVHTKKTAAYRHVSKAVQCLYKCIVTKVQKIVIKKQRTHLLEK